MKARIALILLIIVASGCGFWGPSKYAPYSAWGQQGYSEAPLDSTTYQVTFAGNAYTSPDLVDRYAMYRCAELTANNGYDYFIVIDKNASSATHTSTTEGTPETSIQHDIDPQTGQFVPVAVTTQDYTTTTTTTHSITKTIRMFKGQRPADNLQAFDAKSMLKVMGPTVDR